MNKAGQVVLKMKSKHVGGTFTKKKKRTDIFLFYRADTRKLITRQVINFVLA